VLVLEVDVDAWWAHVQETASRFPDLLPVVKGNGYGFGRAALAEIASQLGSDVVAVGTPTEAHDLLRDAPVQAEAILVLTPDYAIAPPPGCLVTIGDASHVTQLAALGWSGRVVVKLVSSMRRYGVPAAELGPLLESAAAAGLEPVAVAIHPALAGTADEHLAEVTACVDALPAGLPMHVSHLDARAYEQLRAEHPGRPFRIRLGTALWHGTKQRDGKAMLQLRANVVQERPVRRGERAGYRAVEVPGDGWLVHVGVGSAHGVGLLAEGLSPFHYDRRRLFLLEPPHMHTSTLWVAERDPRPGPEAWVDVQNPLIRTTVDGFVSRGYHIERSFLSIA
jgi:alanine racemase